MRPGRVHVVGASGSGTTTLGRALADVWSVPHADADDYFWRPTTPPYVERRPEADRLELMRQVFAPRAAWVLSGSMLGWGEEIVAECDAVVFLTLDPAVRLARLERRERQIRYAGTLDETAHAAFLEWAAGYDDPAFTGRSRRVHEEWLEQVGLPVLRLDSDRPVADMVTAVGEWRV